MTSPLEIVLRGVRTILIGNGASKASLILFELLLARALGATDFGLYAIAIAVGQVVSNLCLMGINYGVIQHLSIAVEKGDGVRQKSAIFFALAAVALAAVCAALALFFGREILAFSVFDKPALAVLLALIAPLMFFDAVNQTLSAVFRGLRQFSNNVLSYDLLKNILCLVILPVIILSGAGAQEALVLCLGAAVCGTVFGMYTLFRQQLFPARAEINFSVLRDLMSFSKLLFLWNVLQVLAVRLFILVAGVFLTSAEAGVLAVATRLALGFIFFQTAVNATVQAEFARFYHLKNMLAQKDLYQTVTQGLLGVAMLLGLVILTDPAAVMTLFGAEYAGYGWMIWPLLFAHLINVVTGPAGQVFVANEKQPLLMKLTVFDIAMQFSMVVPMMHFFGISGAIAGEAVRIFLFVLLRLWVLWRDTGIHIFGKQYPRLLALSLGALGSGMALSIAKTGYGVALAYAMGVYIIGAVWIVAQDADMKAQIKFLLTRASSKPSPRDQA